MEETKTGWKAIQNMPLEQIKSIMDVMQQSLDAYLFILDMTSDVYMIPEKLAKRVAFDSTRIEHCTEALKKVIYPSDYSMVVEDIEKCALGEQSTHALEYRWLSRDNRVIWISCQGTVVTDADGHKLLIGRVNELGKEAKADNVTGLRRGVRFRLNVEEILRDRPDSIRYCMRIGIDNFKEINEKDGKEAGDRVLYELSQCIIDIVPEEVGVYRLVADEFMLMDAGASVVTDPAKVYQQIRSRVEQVLKEKDYTGFYTISAGVINRDFGGRTSNDIMKISEFALNEAKRKGKNQMAYFVQEDYNHYLEQLDMRKELRRDIANQFRGFQVYYQPIVEAESYKIVGAEALLRWQSKKYGNVSPAVMIPIMEESGLIIPVGRYVLREAAQMCKKWQQIVPSFHVNVNLSYVQVHKSDLMNDVNTCIKEVGISPESLVLELTESGYIETDNRIRDLFRDLKEQRINLAIDDFGTGYSNMRYLKEIEAKTIKLDRSFVLQALNNDYDYTIVRHLIEMIHSVGSTVCMEGIEYDHELEKMKKTGPDLIQGYLFGKPAPAEEFEKRLLS
ncbi:MAG: GGDEF and EAL domain-containing protein [Muribaculaceae bacterium]|nr:GGDEF and EAL domain-containing protein [Muribaculaceae bacterium]